MPPEYQLSATKNLAKHVESDQARASLTIKNLPTQLVDQLKRSVAVQLHALTRVGPVTRYLGQLEFEPPQMVPSSVQLIDTWSASCSRCESYSGLRF